MSTSTSPARYFEGYAEGPSPDDAAVSETPKPLDAGGIALPFDHLDGRRFEVLAYRLKKLQYAEPGHRVALMQGARERGRDVVIYGEGGAVVEIVQCKNLDDRLSAAIALRELVKLAIHAFLKSDLLGTASVRYELWSPAGFTADAAQLIDTWPVGWNETATRATGLQALEKYAAFDGLTWEEVSQFVLEKFPQLVTVRRAEGVDITEQVRANRSVYESFFEGRVVVDASQYEDTLQALVTAASSAGIAQFADKDAIHLLDRIASFAPETRIVGSNGYVMGLSWDLVSRFRRAEYAEYARCAMQSTFGITSVVQNASTRIADEFVEELRRSIVPANRSLFHVVRKTLILSMLARLNGLAMPILRESQPALTEYRKLLPEEKLEQHVLELWDDYVRCRDAYDPHLHAFASDEAMRAEIASYALQGFISKEQFETTLRDDINRFRSEINATLSRFMLLIPVEIMVITDTMTVFEKTTLFKRMVETTDELTRRRGSAVIPE